MDYENLKFDVENNIGRITLNRPNSANAITIPQEERDEARNQLNQQSGFSDYAALISELAMRAEISRNEEIISSSSLFD